MLQALVKELQNDVHAIRQQTRELKKIQKNRDVYKTSTHKAQTLAASILNISQSDLEEILDTEDEMVKSFKYLLIKFFLNNELKYLFSFVILRISSLILMKVRLLMHQ